MANMTRFFRLRHPKGFSNELVDMITARYRAWCDAVHARVTHWPLLGIKNTPAPDYIFGDLVLSADRKLLSVRIEGDPGSYGALKLFEDGVPEELTLNIPVEMLMDVETSYENPTLGVAEGEWFRVGV
jgi:hypothetical protein